MISKINFWGVEINSNSKAQIFNKTDQFLVQNNKSNFIVTLNPEILLKAREDRDYGKILNQADLKIVDGVGIKLVSFLKGKKVGNRVTGVDLAEYVLKRTKDLNLKMGLVVNKNGLSRKEDVLKKSKFQIPNSKLFFISNSITEKEFNKLIKELSGVEIILVGLGASYQEQFIWKTKDQLPNLKLAMGVGGTFDFWTGKQKRAPKFMRKIGMEWLWRLFMQPKRLERIWKATVVFGWRGLTNK